MSRPSTRYGIDPVIVGQCPMYLTKKIGEGDEARLIIPEFVSTFIEIYISLCLGPDGQTTNEFSGLSALKDAFDKSKKPITTARISQQLKILKDCGAAKEVKIPKTKTEKGYTLVKLNCIRSLYSHFENKLLEEAQKDNWTLPLVMKYTQEIEQKNPQHFVDMSKENTGRIESHFCIYDAAMKSSARDTRKQISIEYQFAKNDYIKITSVTTTGDGDDIAHLADQRAMRVINGFFVDKLEDNKIKAEAAARAEGIEDFEYTIDYDDGYIVFDIYHLCRKMGLRPNDENLKIARNMIHRLTTTEFRIDATNSWYYRNTYGHDKASFRYLVEYEAYSEMEHVEGTNIYELNERAYKVRIHGDIVRNLMQKGRSFISHPELAREKSGIAHRINNWTKAKVGVTAGLDKQLTYTIEEMHALLLPSATEANFRRDFLKIMRRECVGEWDEGYREGEPLVTTKSLLYGFYFTLEWSPEKHKKYSRLEKRKIIDRKHPIVVSIERDASDEYVGDNSDHNQARRREHGEVIESPINDELIGKIESELEAVAS